MAFAIKGQTKDAVAFKGKFGIYGPILLQYDPEPRPGQTCPDLTLRQVSYPTLVLTLLLLRPSGEQFYTLTNEISTSAALHF